MPVGRRLGSAERMKTIGQRCAIPGREVSQQGIDAVGAPPRPGMGGIGLAGPRQIWPLALLLLIAFSVVGGALWMGGLREDYTNLRDERRILTAQRRELLADLGRVVVDYSWWDEAFRRVAAADTDWLDRNFGEFLFRVHGLDMAVIRSPSGQLVYASEKGVRVGADPSRPFGAVLDGLLPRLSGDNVSGPTPVVAFLRIGKDVYAVAASTILPESESPGVVTAAESSHLVFAKRIDGRLLRRIRRDYAITAPMLTDQP